MVKTVGPAVGSKAQVGFKEETKWGFPASPPNKFVDFNTEGVVSEFTNITSAALRSDRAIHKQRLGTEAAAGDINFEITPEGFGTFYKHALGKKRTKRDDIAMVLVYSGADIDVTLSVSASTITSVGATAGDHLSIALAATHQAVMDNIDASDNWSCYAPWGDLTDAATGGYFARALASKGSSTKTLNATNDYTVVGNMTGLFEVITDVPVYTDTTSGNNSYIFFPIYFKYGIYEHILDAHETLPEGMTFEIGRDIAAFNYYGGRVNVMTTNSGNAGEALTGVCSMMFRGGSTCGDPALYDASNTGWEAPIFEVRYGGTEASAILGIDTGAGADSTRYTFTFEEGDSGSENTLYKFSLMRGYHDHSGYYFETSTVFGLLDFLENECWDSFVTTRKAGFNGASLCTGIKDSNIAALSAVTDRTIYLEETGNEMPLLKGDLNIVNQGRDQGESKTYYIKVTTGGALDGTAAFKGSEDHASWSTAQAITAGVWYNVNDSGDLDTGFRVMWPHNVTLVSADEWEFTSFKDENASPSYETEEFYTGFQAAVTFDYGDGSGLVSQGVMSYTSTLTNNLYGDKYELGDRQRASLTPQRRTVDGTINLEFDDLDVYRMFVNGHPGDLKVLYTSDEYINSSTTRFSMEIRHPNIRFSGTTPVAGGDGIIMTDFPFNSLWDDSGGIPDMRVIIVNGQSYV